MNRKDLNSIKYMLLIFMIVGIHQLYLVIDDLTKTNYVSDQGQAEDKNARSDDRNETAIGQGQEKLKDTNAGRSLSSIPDLKPDSKERKIISKITGQFANSLNKDWQDKLYAKLKHGQSVNTIVDIKHLEGLIEDRGGKNYLMEHVVVKTTLPNGNYYSYHAMVNSESGEIVSSWNYRKSERDETTLKAKAFRR